MLKWWVSSGYDTLKTVEVPHIVRPPHPTFACLPPSILPCSHIVVRLLDIVISRIEHCSYIGTMSNPNHVTGPFEPGTHTIPPPRPASPATAEYRLNHLMLRIKNPENSLKFYNDCFGLHTVFVFNAGPWTIYYLGPRDVGVFYHPNLESLR
jgi:hypothetical protein